jgi:hypothetical protein
MHVYEVRPRKDKPGFDLISDALPFGGLWAKKDAILRNEARMANAEFPSVRDGMQSSETICNSLGLNP